MKIYTTAIFNPYEAEIKIESFTSVEERDKHFVDMCRCSLARQGLPVPASLTDDQLGHLFVSSLPPDFVLNLLESELNEKFDPANYKTDGGA